MLRAAVEKCGSCKGRCAASRNYICYMACVRCASSSPLLSRTVCPIWSSPEGHRRTCCEKESPDEAGSVQTMKAPAMVINHQPPRWQAGTSMRAERKSRAMSEPIGRHSCPGVPLHCDAATSHRIHIFSLHTTDICNIWRSQAPRSAISIPSHTIVRRLGWLSDWRRMKWTKSGIEDDIGVPKGP